MESKKASHDHESLKLTTAVVSPSDVGRLLRELEKVEEHLQQLHVRDKDKEITLPSIGKRLEMLVALNSLNLLHEKDRQSLKDFLDAVKAKAPVLHISFSSDPSPSFLEKLMVWLRREINPLVLLTIGLQPAIGAGCMLRTTNKYFDMSLRQTFIEKRHLLLEQLIPAATEAPSS